MTSRLPLYVLCTGMLMIVLDATVVNVALPSIQDDLHFSTTGLAWVVNAYLVAFGGLLLLAGRLGDLVGRRRIFLTGLGVFTAASLACGLADAQAVLIAARFVQGVGGALTSAVILGMIVTMFREPREQAQAIGVYGFVASGGGAVGLLAGGVLTQTINWHWIFFVNVPVGLATAALALRTLPRDEGIGLAKGADLPGAALITGGLMLAVYTIVGAHDAATRTTVGCAALTLALLAGFVAREATARTPLMPLGIFRSPATSGANAVQALSVIGMFGSFFLGALYLQRTLGYDALQTGLAFLPATLGMAAVSLRLSEPLITRVGPRRAVLAGLTMLAAAMAYFARAPQHGSYAVDVLPVMLLVGIGAGTCFPALMMVAMSGSDPSQAGLASGLVNTSAQVGGALGLAVLATLAASRSDAIAGYHLAFGLGAAFMVAAIVVAFFVLGRQPRRRSASALSPAIACSGARNAAGAEVRA